MRGGGKAREVQEVLSPIERDDAANKIKSKTTYVPYFLDENALKNHSKADVEKTINRSSVGSDRNALILVPNALVEL